MTTTQRDKGGAKPRQRARKTDQKAQRGEKQASAKRNQADQDSMAEPVAPVDQRVEQATNEHVTIEEAPPEQVLILPTLIEEKTENGAAAALSGEVLLPDIRIPVAAEPLQAVVLQTIAAAYADYARKSWAAGRMLAERFMTTRSLEEAVEAQGDFARQTHANFLAHSQKLCELYVGYTRQFFRPWEALATQWTRIGL